MRVLVTWGTKLGGTEGIARTIGEILEHEGFEVVLSPAAGVREVSAFDAAIVGGAVYANRWHRDARKLVARNIAELRRIPVWMFSSGPLDDSADRGDVAPAPEVSVFMERVGARGHVTFGGRLAADATGFPAAAMAKNMSGDWRNLDRVRAWAAELARALPGARPGVAIDPPARSLSRLALHGVAGWALSAAATAALLQIASTGIAYGLRAAIAPAIFIAVAVHYFHARGARAAMPAALTWTAIVAVLDAIVAGAVLGDVALFESFVATWLPWSLIAVVTWITGAAMSTMPWPKPADRSDHGAHPSLGRS